MSESDPTAAEELLKQCLVCEDVGPATYNLLATLRSDRGAPDSARDMLQSGVRRFPESVLLWRALGRLELSMSRTREGLSALTTAHRLDPEDEALETEYRQVVARYGTEEDRVEADVHPLLLEALGRFEIDDAKGALQVLEIARAKAQKSPRMRALVRYRMASILEYQHEYSKALALLDSALVDASAKNTLRADLLVSRSEVRLAEGDPKGAARDANEAATIEPKNPLAHANLALAKSLEGDIEGAMASLARAIDCGLGRRLTKEQFLSIGTAVERLRSHPNFRGLLEQGWPTRPSDPTPTTAHPAKASVIAH